MENYEMNWIDIGGFLDPPEPPKGYLIQVKYDSYMGYVTHYRFVKKVNLIEGSIDNH